MHPSLRKACVEPERPSKEGNVLNSVTVHSELLLPLDMKHEDDIDHHLKRMEENSRQGPDRYTPLERCPALILNADFRPLSYYPLSLWSWQEAVKAIFRETVTVVSEYTRTVRAPGLEMRLPSVLALKEFVPVERTPAFTRFNVFLRDDWECQYCGEAHKTQELTFDHVIPRSRGGRTSWNNIVTACRSCNTLKGSAMPHECGMQPQKPPVMPSVTQLQQQGRKYPPNFLHESWSDFLYWDTELVEQ
jgi:5-methylcytosine-specific restriction endonuclease McrA